MTILGYSIFKILFFIGVAAIGWLVVYGLRHGLKDVHWCHKKKYVRLNLYSNWNCSNGSHPVHTEAEGDWWATAATWVCEEPGCNATGVDCMGADRNKWWKIENGQVILDEKKITSPPTDVKSPKEQMEERKAKSQGLIKAVNVSEAIELLTDLAVLAKKGQIQVSHPPPTAAPLKEVPTALSAEERAKKEDATGDAGQKPKPN